MAKIDLDFFEKVIFQNILKKDTVFLASVVEHLEKSIFKDKNIGSIVDLIKNFYLSSNNIPSITEIKIGLSTASLKNAFKEAVESIRNFDSNYNDVELVKNTEYFLKQRKYYQLVEKAVEMQSEKKEIDSDEIQKEMEKIHAISLIDNLGLDYFLENERVVNYLLEKEKFISSGYRKLDNAFGGGLFAEGKSLYCIGGETNVGKSLFLGNIATNLLLQDLNVVIYTMEMSEMRYAKRISGILTGIALATLADNITNYKEYIADFIRKYKSRLIIKEFPTKSVSAKHIYAYTQTLMRKKGFTPNALIFDYHSLLKPSVSQPSKHAELQYITQECRALTYMFNAPGLTVAQLNRSSHKANKPGLDSISGSWDLISDLDGMVNVSQTDQDREANLIRFSGEKCRDGSKGVEGHLNIDYNTLRLTEDEEYDDNQSKIQDEKNISELIDMTNIMD